MEEKSFLPNSKPEKKETLSSKTWKIQKDRKRLSRMIDQQEAVCQAAEVILDVPRFAHLIYSADFGQELSALIGQSVEYIRAEAPRLITEALLADERIQAVTDFSFSIEGDSMNISFRIESTWGKFQSEVKL